MQIFNCRKLAVIEERTGLHHVFLLAGAAVLLCFSPFAAHADCPAYSESLPSVGYKTSTGTLMACNGTSWVSVGVPNQWQNNGSNIYYNGGAVGIGTSDPTANGMGFTGWGNPKMAIYANGYDGLNIRVDSGNNAINIWHKDSGNYGFVSFSSGTSLSSAGVGSIATNGTSVSYNTTSDRRLKKDIIATHYTLDDLLRLQVRDFRFIADPDHKRQTGFIAQEIADVFPDAVVKGSDKGTEPLTDKQKAWQVDYGRLTPLLVKALQDLNAQNVALGKRVEALEAQQK